MTAFAYQEIFVKAKGNPGDGELIWELRCVNHRFLEQTIRLPEELRILEPQIRERIAQHLRRGKVECILRAKPRKEYTQLILNYPLAEHILQLTHHINELLANNAAPISPLEILRWPGILQHQETDLNTIHPEILNALNSLLSAIIANREREGSCIAVILEERLKAIEEILARIQTRLPEILIHQREQLNSRLAQAQLLINSERLEQEILFFAQRIDVQEELDRIHIHIAEVRRIILTENEGAGRRLDFLMQELNREINTLGSKSLDIFITQATVNLKVLLEQMREQIQNLE